MKRSAIASSTTAIATSSPSARLRSDRIRSRHPEVPAPRAGLEGLPTTHPFVTAGTSPGMTSLGFSGWRRRGNCESREMLRHRAIDLAPERHRQLGDAVEPFPSPLVEFRRLAVAWRQRIDFIIGTGEAQREPFLALAAEFCQPVR